MQTPTQRPGSRTGPPTRADFLGWPKGLLPIEEKVRRLESRVKQLEAIAYGTNPPQAWQRAARLKKIVASHYVIPWRYLAGRFGHAPVPEALHLAIWLCNRVLGCSIRCTAEFFGRRDLHSVRYSIDVIEARLATEPKFRAQVAILQKKVETECTQ